MIMNLEEMDTTDINDKLEENKDDSKIRTKEIKKEKNYQKSQLM